MNIENGWIKILCDAHDLSTVEIGIGSPQTSWRHAYRDFDGRGRRCAQVRPTPDSAGQKVFLRVDGQVTSYGALPV